MMCSEITVQKSGSHFTGQTLCPHYKDNMLMASVNYKS